MDYNEYGENFCLFYNEYLTGLSKEMGDYYLNFLQSKNIKHKKMLDLMCGPGKMMSKFLEAGWEVRGVDSSRYMLNLAMVNTNLPSTFFVNKDVMEIDFENEFSVVTCTADGVNHLKTIDFVHRLFQLTYQALKGNGYFLFDMDTRLGIIRNDSFVASDDEYGIAIRNGIVDLENNIGLTKFKGVVEINGEYKRFDSIIHNYIYKMDAIYNLLEDVGFKNIRIFDGDFNQKESVKLANAEDLERVIFIAFKE